MRRLLVGLIVSALAACSRDTSLPPPPGPPGPGTIYGRVVYSQPGQVDKVPAAGATVQVLGTTLAVATTDSDGRFLVAGITSASGQLLVRFDASATGTATNQVLIDLGTLGVGPGRQIGLGDVVVTQNAQLHGKALRGDVAGTGGHGGTVVYVPQGPYTTYTGDDGSFQLLNLPAGTLSVAFFRIGYETVTVDGVTLRAGEDFALRDQTLMPETGGSATPGSIAGHVSFSPTTSATGTTVAAVDGLGSTLTGSVSPTGDFTISPVPPGLYQVTVSQVGYTSARVPNVLLGPGQALTLPAIVLDQVGTSAGTLCVAGSACQPANLCRLGSVSCSGGGAATCVEGANAIDGTACGSGLVCDAGTCVPFCVGDGSTCSPSNACHVGVTVCTGTGPVCSDTGANLPDGASCAPSMVCSSGSCVPCSGVTCGVCSTVCVPTNPCHLGSQICGTGSAGCTDLGTPAADGTGCGTNQVCLAGSCVACASGVLCQPANPCKTGITSCSAGTPVCAETGNLGDGVACGGANTCRAGVCTPPQTTMGTLAFGDPSYSSTVWAPTGVVVASSGDVYFSDSNHQVVKRIPAAGGAPVVVAGTLNSCGYTGDGGPATSAQLCYPKGLALDESGSGTLYVADSSNGVIRQIALGGGTILTFAGGGAATSAPYGDGGLATAATLSNPTRLVLAWDTASPPVRWLYVTDANRARVRRVQMASGIISTWLAAAGACGASVALYDCGTDPAGCALAFDGQGNGFVSGRLCGGSLGGSVAYGVLRVSPAGPFAQIAGQASGSGAEGINAKLAAFSYSPALALDAAGNLLVADYGTNKVRRIDGASGRIDTLVNSSGAASTTGDGGLGTAATIDHPWEVAFDPITRMNLVITEYGGDVVRIARGAGSSVPPAASLAPAGGTSQTTSVDQVAPAPISVVLKDGGGAPLAGYAVTFTSLTPGGSVSSSSAVTNGSGVAAVMPRAGQAPQAYQFQASFTDIHGGQVTGSPVTFTLTATPVPIGTIQAVVNAPRTSGNTQGGPAAVASTSGPVGLAVAPDGTLFFADYSNHQVKAVDPSGLLSVVAGTGACGSSGDGGPATAATLCNPKELALDAPAGRLYVSDYGNARVRVVNLAAGTIDLVAGSGAAPSPGYGDGGNATAATLASPTHLAVHDDSGLHWLYITDHGHGRIRRVQLTAGAGFGVISAAFTPAGACSGNISWYSCGSEPGCAVTWDAFGNAFISGLFCGTDLGGSTANGVARVAPGGALTHVAGQYAGSSAEGISARAAAFSYPPALALDAAGNLFTSDWGGDRLRRIDGASGRIDTVAGTGVATSTGDGGPATSATIDNPWAIVFDPTTLGTLYLSDYGGNAVRVIPGAGSATPPVAALAAASATIQTVAFDQQGSPLAVSLTGQAGAALSGYRVLFTSLTPGGSLSSPAALTSSGGVASSTPRAGLSSQSYLFQASFADIHGNDVAGSPVTFTVNATAPAAGTIGAIVDLDRTTGNTGLGGPASVARINGPTGVAVASNGTVYFSDYVNDQVKAVAPSGLLTLVAGTGSGGYSGDGGPATAATINGPRGLVLDEARGKLYVADSVNARVRVVDLGSGRIDTFAGGGAAPAPGYGDGGAANAATLSNPTQVVLWKDPISGTTSLYVTDFGHGRIRRIDVTGASAGVINAFLTPTSSCTGPIGWYSCGSDPGCSVAFDGSGTGFVSGTFCGSDFGASYTNGVARFAAGAPVTQIAGSYSGSGAEAISARGASFSTAPALALDAAGNLYTLDWSGQKIRRIDGASGRIDTVVGTGATGSGGDGGSPLQATLYNPYLMTFDPVTLSTLYLSDYNGNAVRVVPGLGSTVPSTASLALSGGSGQSVLVDQVASPFSVTLADGAGAPLVGYRVDFSATTAGASVGSPRAPTGALGLALTSPRVGQLPQGNGFLASFLDIHGNPVSGSPVAISVTASAPLASTAFAVVDVDRVGANTGAGGPGTLAHVNGPYGAAMSSGGTLYFSDYYNHQVKALAPNGLLTVLAGTGSCGLSGDGGQGTAAVLCNPKGLALDETAPGWLYVADSGNNRVRVVNLSTGVISAVAGGGTASAAPWGDGGPATSAVLSNPSHVRLNGGKVYVGDVGHNMVRVVNLGDGSISTFVKNTGATCPTTGTLATDVVFNACSSDQGCDVAFDAGGTAYVSGQFCGGVQMGGWYFDGIMATTDGVALTHVAGKYNTPPAADGSAPASTPLQNGASLLMGGDGRLYYMVQSEHALRVIDFGANAVGTVIGAVPAPSPTPGNGADYLAPGSTVLLSSPWDFALQPGGGHAAVCDTANDTVRLIW